MKSKSATLTKQLLYQRWVEEIKACESRPVGMSIASWCRENGIKQPTYYAHLHKVKELCLDLYGNDYKGSSEMSIIPTANSTDVSVVETPQFVELTLPKAGIKPAIIISIGKSKIEIFEDISDSFLRRLLGALNNA